LICKNLTPGYHNIDTVQGIEYNIRIEYSFIIEYSIRIEYNIRIEYSIIIEYRIRMKYSIIIENRVHYYNRVQY